MPTSPPDVLVVSVGATTGWRAAARELADGLARGGAHVQTVDTGPVPTVRTFMLTDFVQALAARRSTACALAAEPGRVGAAGGGGPAIVYCSMTAALLWPRPGAIWLDSLARENRPGRHGLWQRPMETRRLAAATLVLTMAENSLAPLGSAWPAHVEPIVVPVAVDPSGPVDGVRDIDVLAYTGDPVKRRLDFILGAWERARREGETLVVAGIDRDPAPPGVRFAGRLAPAEYRQLVRRARVYVAAPRREDFGIAPLEALADGCQLVTTPAPGPYVALGLARRLDPRLVAEDLAPALRHALDEPRADYAARAAELLAPFHRAAVDRTLAERVLPRLLARWAPQ
ncbi:MAG: glycosyltransferase [Solirubrobacteraceae bacterium]